jgi:methylated-DNA-protein-cysteine methyltransferase-like protein
MTTAERDKKILACINSIPRGKVAAYGQIASLAGIKRGHRVVAHFLKHQVIDKDLPWHRLIRADGFLGMERDSKPYKEQVQRLQAEGVIVKSSRVNMRTYQWQPDLDFLLFHPDL